MMSNQTFDLEAENQLIGPSFFEQDWQSSLMSDEEQNIDRDRALELETSPIGSTIALSLDDSDTISPLYLTSLAMERDDSETFEHNESDTYVDETDTDISTEESDIPLTNTITAGDEGGTQFTFNFAEDTPTEAIDGITQAAENWRSVLTDDVNVNIDFTFNPAEEGNLGGAIPNQIPISYESLSQALAEDVSSQDDQTAVAHLPEENIDILINNTRENNGGDTPYLDNNGGLNNSFVVLNTANARALGIDIEDIAESLGITPEEAVSQLGINAISDNFLFDPNLPDGAINMNSDVIWDFSPCDGISADAVDFVGIMSHEIGHVLGFTTNAEQLDLIADPNFDLFDVLGANDSEEINGLITENGLGDLLDVVDVDGFISENEYLLQVFDLFRYSPESFEQGAVDYTAGNIDDKYFSIDGGNTVVATLSTGTETGDGRQLSHWEDDLISGTQIGIMDPSGDLGDLIEISDTDLLAFDVIGWDIA